jgi:hypothetical protein
VAGRATGHGSRVPFRVQAIFGVPSTRESENEIWASICCKFWIVKNKLSRPGQQGNGNGNSDAGLVRLHLPHLEDKRNHVLIPA